MLTQKFLCILVVTLIAPVLSQAQDVIGVNFLGRNANETNLDAADFAGVIVQSNWRNLESDTPNFDGLVSNLQTANGTETSVEFEWDFNDSWNSSGPTTTPNDRLFKGIQKANPNPDTDEASSFVYMRWKNLPTNSAFNAVVYQVHNGANARSEITAGGITYYTTQPTSYTGSFTRSASTSTSLYENANYVQFDSLVPDADGTIEIVAKKRIEVPQLTDGIGIPAAQLQLVSGTWPTVDPPQITQQPTDVLGVVGEEVLFQVGIDGPWTVEWRTNGVEAVTGPETNFQFTPDASLKDATVYAVVFNSSGAVTSETVSLTLDDPTPAQFVRGFIRVETYSDVGGTATANLKTSPKFQARDFDDVRYISSAALPNDGLSNFGRLIEGYYSTDTTADHFLFIRSDDNSELWLDPTPDGPVPNNYTATANAFESGCCNDFQEPPANQTSDPLFLNAGDRYPFSAMYKQGGGGVFWQMAIRSTNDTTLANQLQPIEWQNLYSLISPSGKRATITQQPEDVTVNEGLSATFTVAAETLPRDNEFIIQWNINGSPIDGENNATLTMQDVRAVNNGDVITASIYSLIGEIISDPATLTVIPDVTPSALISAGFFQGTNRIGILFDEPIDLTTATNVLNYTIDNGSIAVTSAELVSPTENVVLLVTDSSPTPGHVLAVNGVQDLFGNTTDASTMLETSSLLPNTLVNGATDPLLPGRAVYLGQGNFYQESGGSDIWNNRDAGFFTHTAWTGAFDIAVRVQTLEGPNTWTKAGIMMRESLDGGSRNVFVLSTRTAGQNISTLQWRDTADMASVGIPAEERVSPVPYPNNWLRLTRADANSNVFEGFHSSNGIDWESFGTHTIPPPALPQTLYIGMASTSHDNTPEAAIGETIYRSFSISGDPQIQPVPLQIQSTGTNFQLNWDPTSTWILQTTTNLITGTWIDVPGAVPPINLGTESGKDFYRLRLE